MSGSSTIDIPSSVLDAVRKFRLKPSSKLTALVFKIDKPSLTLGLEEQLDSGLDDLQDLLEELPENSPRFVVVNYKLSHRDGRISYPLFLMYWAPATSSLEQSTLYASALSNFSVQADLAKIIDIRDPDISTAAIDSRLGA